MHTRAYDIREDYRLAARSFATIVRELTPGDWVRPALGVWNGQDLVGHTSRALLTVETYLQATPTTSSSPTLENAAAYFQATTAALADPAAVADRGRQAGAALGERPAEKVVEIVDRVLALVDQHPDDALVTTPVGAMTLINYLPTRIFELVVHSHDLAAAAGIDPPPELDRPTASVLSTAVELVAARGDAARVLLALTGRRALPDGWSLV